MRAAFLPLVVCVLIAPAATAEMSDELGDSRYVYNKVDDGYLRLDMRTGQVSLCAKQASDWLCRAVADDRAAFEAEIARLQNDNAALKRALLGRGSPLPSVSEEKPAVPESPPTAQAGPPKPPAEIPPATAQVPKDPSATDAPSEPDRGIKPPNDADLDRTMAFIEKLWKRLVEMMVNLQRDLQKKT